MIDKAPTEFPELLLKKWKTGREEEVNRAGCEEKFASVVDLKAAVTRILIENHSIWKNFGPKSEAAEKDPASNLAAVWGLRKLDTILPNNRKILNLIEANLTLLSRQQYEAYISFKHHAMAFEKHQFDRLDNYPTFPREFEERFWHD